MSQFTAEHDRPIDYMPVDPAPAPEAAPFDRVPHTTHTLHGVVLTGVMIRALHEVVTNDTRYDLATILPARTAAALFRRSLVRYTGHGEQVLPTSRGVWTLYELAGVTVPATIVNLFVPADRDDAIREYAHRTGMTVRAARTLLDYPEPSDGERVARLVP